MVYPLDNSINIPIHAHCHNVHQNKWANGIQQNSIAHYSLTRSNLVLKLQIWTFYILRYLDLQYEHNLSHDPEHFFDFWTN